MTHVYDEDGRLVRSVESPEFLDEDRALLLAYREWKSEQCPGCGQPKATAWHPDNGGFLEVAHRFTCHGCTALRADHASASEGETKEVEPVEYLSLVDTRDYDARPLPEVADL